MIRINLLTEKITPARARTRAPGGGARNLLFGLIVAATLIIVGGLWYLNNSKLNQLDEDIIAAKEEKERLQTIIRQVEEYDAKKQELNQKIDIISELKKNQTGPVHLLDEVSKALPNLVWLTSMRQRGNRINIDGEAITYNAVADFISNLRKSPFVKSPDLLNSEEKKEIVTFNLTFLFSQPEEETSEEG